LEKRRAAILEGPLGPTTLKFGLPLAIAMGLQATFNLIDLMIIGNLPNGPAAVGGLVICDMVAVIGTIFMTGISNAAVGVVSRFAGRGDRSGLNHATWNSIFIVLILSLVFGLLGVVGAELIIGDMVGAQGEVREIAISYLRILVGNSWTIFFLLHLTAVMRAMGSAKWPTIILIAANVLNIFLDVIMVYGPGPAPEIFAWGGGIAEMFGISRMGVDGAAWATVIARGLGCAAAAFMLLRFESGPRWIWSEVRPHRKELWRLIRIGAPASAQYVVRITAVLVALSLVTRVYTSEGDETVLAAFGICLRLDMLALFTTMGFASAAATMVGMNLGAENAARAMQSGWVTSAYTAVLMLILAVVYLIFADPIIRIFVDQDAVVEVGREYLWIVVWSYLFIGIAVVLSNGLQGATDTISSFLIDAVVVLLIQIPVMLLLVLAADMPRSAIWYSIAGANAVSAFVYIWWFRKGRWTRLELD